MNKKIFNIGRLFSILAVMALTLTACEKDDPKPNEKEQGAQLQERTVEPDVPVVQPVY